MISNPDLADVVTQADASGAKVILAGDTQQLQAVENGGGMSLLADALGYAQLTEPVRFRAAWEQAASLRLRAGDTSVLAEYDQHGRIRGGEPEQMMDAAAAAYLALTLDGTDTLLMAADHALRRELSRRVREDLIRLGVVAPGPAVRIADGAAASPGDLIICTRNDHTHRGGGARPHAGQRRPAPHRGRHQRWADRPPRAGRRPAHRPAPLDRPALPVRRNYGAAELGYAVTDHVAQGRTVTAGLAVITGTEDRPHALVALTRGTTINLAYVFTASPKRADPVPGPRPAPELARYDQVHAERAGTSAPATPAAPPGEALAVLSAVLERDGQLLSATQDRHRALTGADHLAILNAIWTAETAPARQQRYQDLLMASLPPGHRGEPGPPGEMAVADPARRRAGRPGPGADPGRRDRRTGPGRIPRPGRRHRRPPPPPPRLGRPAPGGPVVRAGPRHRRPRTPRLRGRDRRADGRPQGPDRRARRRQRPALGGEHPGPGPRPPAGPAGLAAPRRLHRRLAGTIRLRPPRRPDRPRTRRGRPGPARRLARGPGRPRPRRRPRRARHARRDAAAPARHLPHRDRLGPAIRRRRAPPGPRRRLGRPPGRRPRRRRSPSRPAPRPARAKPPGSRRWPPATGPCTTPTPNAKPPSPPSWPTGPTGTPPPAHQRHLAVAADAELRRRHPARQYPPLRSAEPPPATQAQRDELTLTAGEQIPETAQWIKDLAAQRHAFADKLADRQSLMIPAEDPDYGDLGQAFPPWPAPARAAILQPPKPEIQPSERILERALEPDLDMEAAD